MHRLGLSATLLLCLAARARCQAARGVAEGSLDIGGALLSQPGLASTSVYTAAGQLRFAAPVYALTMNGVAARTPDDRFTGQGVLSASRYAAPFQRARWEIGGMASGFGVSNAGPAFGWQLLAREHFTGSLGGVFVGGSGGAVSQAGYWRGVLNAHSGGYLRLDAHGRDELSAALSFTDGGVMPDGSRFRNGDAIAYWTHRSGPIELLAGGGVRAYSLSRSIYSGWGSANVVLWITNGAGIVVAGGRALEDVTRGVPAARYLSASFRFGGSRGTASAATLVHRVRPEEDGGRIDVRAGDDSLRVVTVRLRGASTVELMGDFTDWEPVSMTQLPNGEWSLERIVARGTHHVAIRVNGGSWGAPPNLPHVSDEFGGEVGLLIVP
ncbi:MAG TPA: glycogen-binding domain-containing protein [Gemmatimonadaceae bacterium]|nr:glycogen-binding domain-containing protein [Gemmatimonadaceae bacterium]